MKVLIHCSSDRCGDSLKKENAVKLYNCQSRVADFQLLFSIILLIFAGK